MIQVYLLLKDLDCSSKVLLLLRTIIKIGEISYSYDHKRSPRQLLQLYNTCWIHLELCRDLFSSPRKLTRSKMFGHYVHAITAHSPTQYELGCLRSMNTENQVWSSERDCGVLYQPPHSKCNPTNHASSAGQARTEASSLVSAEG